MKRFYTIAGLGLLAAFGAVAQDEGGARLKMKIEAEKVAAQTRIVGVRSALIGSTVKNAPYSAVEVTEFTQVLADGTRIHNETRTSVYRDSEGRLRRETPNDITIWDPVANTSYVLNPQTMTARKISVHTMSFSPAPGTKVSTFTMSTDGPAEAIKQKIEAVAGAVKHDVLRPEDVKIHTELKAVEAQWAGTEADLRKIEVAQSPAVAAARPAAGGGAVVGGFVAARHAGSNLPATEALGRQVIEGVPADGTRITSVIETGAIGNDRPLKTVTERWHSAELQTLVMSKQTDPRTGEESFRLTNVNRSEPAAYLFQVPAGYKMPDTLAPKE